MKKRVIILVLTVLIFTSCVKDEDRSFEGFTFRFSNHTNLEYNSKIFIGGMKNGIFTPTDSISIVPSIKVSGNNSYYFGGENRWKPNLGLIRELPSGSCYFLLKLSDSREELVKIYNNNATFSISIPNGEKILDDEGRIRIYIYDNEIFGENQ